MQLQKSELSLETSGNFKEIEFDIDKENIGLILETLRSKMYSDPIGAICREVASNSRDANREVGNLTPTEIIFNTQSIWTENNPVVIFKDNGPGISPRRVADVFVKFGASTKRLSNLLTGGFGYGAKTPFAYTDTFYIRTVHNYIEYTYIAALDESRRGKLLLLNENNTSQGNGTEIIIPLKREDVNEFHKKVLFYTSQWDIPPKYTGIPISSIETHKIEFYENNSEYAFGRADRHYSVYKGVFALIDGIPYKINSKNLNIIVNDYDAEHFVLFVKFNNGVLPVSTNRETIFINDASKQNLSDALIKAIDDFGNKVTQSVEKLTCPIDIYTEMYKIYLTEKGYIFNYASGHSIKLKGKYVSKTNFADQFFPLSSVFATYKSRYGKNVKTEFNTFGGMAEYIKHEYNDYKFYIRDKENVSLKTKYLQEQGIKYILVNLPSRRFIDLAEQFKVKNINNTIEFGVLKAQNILPGNIHSIDYFIKYLKEEEANLINWKVFVDKFKPQLISTVPNFKLISKRNPLQKPVLIEMDVILGGEKYATKLTFDANNKTFNSNVSFSYIYPIYAQANFAWENFTRQMYYSFTYIKNNVAFVRVKSKTIEKLLKTNFKFVENKNLLPLIFDQDKLRKFVLSQKAEEERKTTRDINYIHELDNTISFLEVNEKNKIIKYLDHKNVSDFNRGIVVSEKLIRDWWNEFDSDEKKTLSDNIKALQCIIVKYKSLFLFDIIRVTENKQEAEKVIKQILQVQK